MKQQLQRGSTTDQLVLRLYDHNRLVIPSAATIEVRSPDGNALIASGTAASVASDGVVSYTPGVAVTSDYEEDLLVEWNLTIGGVVKTVVELFDVVNFVLHGGYSLVTDEDLIDECSRLTEERYLHYGTAESGTTTTLVDQGLKEFDNDHWKGGTLQIVDGRNKGDIRPVTGFLRSTGTLTVSPALSATSDATSVYLVKRTYQREINRAWEDVQAWIMQRGYRPALILNIDELKPIVTFAALEKICRTLSSTPDDVWWKRADYYSQACSERWNGMTFKYDIDEDEEVSMLTTPIMRLRR